MAAGHSEAHGHGGDHGHGAHGHGGEKGGGILIDTIGAPVEAMRRTITRKEFLFQLRDVMYSLFGGFVSAIFRRGKGGGGHGGGGGHHKAH